MVVWKQQRSSTLNMICGQANCYSNCRIDYESNIPHDLHGFFEGLGLCDKCNHSLWNHHRCRAKWDQVMKTQATFDQDMKKWEAAKDGMEKTAILVAVREKTLYEMIDRATSNLRQLVERYAYLSLSGSFSAQVDSTVRLLEQKYTGLVEKSVDQDHLRRVEESLVNMRRKLMISDISEQRVREERVVIDRRW